MKREIKFRAWRKPNEDEFYEGEMFYSRSEEFKRAAALVYIDDDGAAYPEDYEWMQFTGFEDKNGIEIFEGDIVTIYDPYIETQDGVPIAELPENRIEKIRWENGAWMCGDEMLWEEASGCDVVGNVFENPEFLDAA